MKFEKREISVGYTTGVFDLFHIGHVNLLRNAKSMCDRLIVGVSVDELVRYKHKTPVIPFEERIEIVRSCQYVDVALPQLEIDKVQAWKKLKFDTLFVGDDWFEFSTLGVRVVYFPYTQGTSSTLINHTLNELRESK